MSSPDRGLPSIGILGGGQLAKMLAQEALRMDLQTSILDPDPSAPALKLATRATTGTYSDEAALLRATEGCDVVTFDLEHVDVSAARALAARGVRFCPSLDVLEVVQDKLHQKQHLLQAGLPVPEFREGDELGALGWPVIQKTRRAGYDGKGVRKLNGPQDEPLQGPSMIERLVDIEKEISVLVVRSETELRAFAPVEMVFDPQLNLLDLLVAPGDQSAPWAAEATALATKTVQALGAVGVMAVELFLDKQGALWVNEVAPRPHNSGHHTIEAALSSQYEQHLRAICGLPLGSTRQMMPAAMANLIGQGDGPARVEGLSRALAIEGVSVHIYGKALARKGRKMGHITALAPTIEAAVERVKQARAALRITGGT